MGALLGQQTTADELGVAPVIPGIIAGGAAGGAIAKLFGGGKRSCKGKQRELAKAINQYLSYSDRRSLVQGMENPPSPTPTDMAYFFVGGKDCKHRNVTPGDQRFLDRLPLLIQQRAEERAQQARQKQNNSTPTDKTASSNAGSGAESNVESNQKITSGSFLPTTQEPNTIRYLAIGAGVLTLASVAVAIAK